MTYLAIHLYYHNYNISYADVQDHNSSNLYQYALHDAVEHPKETVCLPNIHGVQKPLWRVLKGVHIRPVMILHQTLNNKRVPSQAGQEEADCMDKHN